MIGMPGYWGVARCAHTMNLFVIKDMRYAIAS